MVMLWCILLYSGMGWLLEVGYARVKHGAWRGRKNLLLLPMCPVYGLGGGVLLALPQFVTKNLLLLAVCGALSATAAEFLMALFYERVCRVSFWDYHAYSFQVKGRICLRFSCWWGVLSVLFLKVIHPVLAPALLLLPDELGIVLGTVFFADFCYTAALLRQLGDTAALDWKRFTAVRWLEASD